jgi:hypothetical protein
VLNEVAAADRFPAPGRPGATAVPPVLRRGAPRPFERRLRGAPGAHRWSSSSPPDRGGVSIRPAWILRPGKIPPLADLSAPWVSAIGDVRGRRRRRQPASRGETSARRLGIDTTSPPSPRSTRRTDTEVTVGSFGRGAPQQHTVTCKVGNAAPNGTRSRPRPGPARRHPPPPPHNHHPPPREHRLKPPRPARPSRQGTGTGRDCHCLGGAVRDLSSAGSAGNDEFPRVVASMTSHLSVPMRQRKPSS